MGGGLRLGSGQCSTAPWGISVSRCHACFAPLAGNTLASVRQHFASQPELDKASVVDGQLTGGVWRTSLLLGRRQVSGRGPAAGCLAQCSDTRIDMGAIDAGVALDSPTVCALTQDCLRKNKVIWPTSTSNLVMNERLIMVFLSIKYIQSSK